MGALLAGQYKEPWQVPWGLLVAGRDAALTHRRWQVLRNDGNGPKRGGLELPDCVAVMAQHYCPHVWGRHIGASQEDDGA